MKNQFKKLSSLLLAVLLVLCCAACESVPDDAETEKELSYENGYDAGRSDGYQEGLAEGPSCEEIYNGIENMKTDEILKYLEETTGEQYHSHEETYNIYVYGFIKGYRKAQSGIWDEWVDEYVNGYEYEPMDNEYSFYFP